MTPPRRPRRKHPASALLVLSLSLLATPLRAEPAPCWPPPVALDPTSVAPRDPACPAADIPSRAFSEQETIGLLGEKVRGPSDEDLGQIIDVIVDRAGRPVAAVIDFGGFLGVGSRKIAVDWRALAFDPSGKAPVRLALSRAEIQAAPEYKRGAPVAEPPARLPPPAEPPPPASSKDGPPPPSASGSPGIPSAPSTPASTAGPSRTGAPSPAPAAPPAGRE